MAGQHHVFNMASQRRLIDRKDIQKLLTIPGHTGAAWMAEGPRIDKSDDHCVTGAEGLSSFTNGSEVTKDTLFLLGSLMKPIIATALGFIIEEPAKLPADVPKIKTIMKKAWEEQAFEIWNKLRKARDEWEIGEGLRTTERPKINAPTRVTPSIGELILHIGALPPNQLWAWGPQSTFLSSNEFVERFIGPLVDATDELDPDASNGSSSYSNWNYMVAGMIVAEAMGKSLAESLKELVLKPLKMFDTVVDMDGFQAHKHRIADAFIQTTDSDGCHSVPQPCYFNDDAELASGGGYSTVEDIAKLLRFLMEKYHEAKWPGFVSGTVVHTKSFGYVSTVQGNFGEINSLVLRSQSYDQNFSIPSYQLGKPKSGKNYPVIVKAGATKGYSCHYFMLPTERVFVIVLTNSSGIVDMSNHIGQYILQQVFETEPKVKFDEVVRKIQSSRMKYLSSRINASPSQTLFTAAELADLEGIYKQEVSVQQDPAGKVTGHRIEVSLRGHEAHATVEIRGSVNKTKRTDPLNIVRISENTFTLRARIEETTIDGYDLPWLNVEFKMCKDEGRVSALEIQWTCSKPEFQLYERVTE